MRINAKLRLCFEKIVENATKKEKFFSKNRYVVNVEFFVHNLCKIDNLCSIYTKLYSMLKDGKVNKIYLSVAF